MFGSPSSSSHGKVIEITSKAQFDKILRDNAKTLVVADFYADWCGPCKQISPFIADLSTKKQYSHIVFVKVNTESNRDIPCPARSIPTFCFYLNNSLKEHFSGADPNRIVSTIQKLAPKQQNAFETSHGRKIGDATPKTTTNTSASDIFTPNPAYLKTLIDMGYPADISTATLKQYNNNIEFAVNDLLSKPMPSADSGRKIDPSSTFEPTTPTTAHNIDGQPPKSQGSQELSLEERTRIAQQKIQEHKAKLAEAEAKRAITDEAKRREQGKTMAHTAEEYKLLKAQRDLDAKKRAQAEEKARKKKIKAQIKAEKKRREREAQEAHDRAAGIVSTPQEVHNAPPKVHVKTEIPPSTAIQFKLPDGHRVKHKFDTVTTTIATLYAWVAENTPGIGPFFLQSPADQKILTGPDMLKNMAESDLAPRALLVVMPKE